jgi:hypothetical protein
MPQITTYPKTKKQIKCKKKASWRYWLNYQPFQLRAYLKQKTKKFNEVFPKNHKTIK